MAWLLLLCVLSCATFGISEDVEFLEGITKCSKNDPNINECLKNALQEAMPYVAKGIPSLNVAPLDPLISPKLELEQKEGPVKVKASFTDFYTNGYCNTTVTSAKSSANGNKLEFFLFGKTIKMGGNYKIHGNIFNIGVEGTGVATFAFDNITLSVTVVTEKEKRGGEDYLHLKELKLTMDPKTFKLDLTNLFQGNAILGKAVNRILNQFSMELFAATKELAENTLSGLIREAVEPLYGKVPVSKMFI